MTQAHNPNLTGYPQAGQTGDPAPTNEYAGFSAAAIGLLVGAVLSLSSYFLVWYYVTADPDATVNGFGQVTESDRYDIEFESSKIHWVVLGTAAVLLVLAVIRLVGKFNADLGRPAVIVAVLGVIGGLFNAFIVSDGFSAGTGVYLALVGTVISVAAVLAMVFAKK